MRPIAIVAAACMAQGHALSDVLTSRGRVAAAASPPVVRRVGVCHLSLSASDAVITNHGRCEALRVQLADAISNEQYTTAARLRDELENLLQDERLVVLAANERFYAALRTQDEASLTSLWDDGSLASACTRMYPGFAPLRGRSVILDCWRQVRSDQHVRVDGSNLRCTILRGALSAVVTMTEIRIGAGAGDEALSTTNVFEKAPPHDEWKLVLHQAWPIVAAIEEMGGADYDADDFPGATG